MGGAGPGRLRSATIGCELRWRVTRRSSGSRRWWAHVRRTLATIDCVAAPRGVRFPPQTFRVTTAGRIACSTCQLVASTSGRRRHVKSAGRSVRRRWRRQRFGGCVMRPARSRSVRASIRYHARCALGSLTPSPSLSNPASSSSRPCRRCRGRPASRRACAEIGGGAEVEVAVRVVAAGPEEDPLGGAVGDVQRQHALVVRRRTLEVAVRDRHDLDVVPLDDGGQRPHAPAAVVQDRVVRVDVKDRGGRPTPASVAIHNQFGDEALTAVSARSLCVPSTLP